MLVRETLIGLGLGFLWAVVPLDGLGGWTNPTSGTAEYLDPARWAGGVIDNRFDSGLTLTGSLTVRLDQRHATGTAGLLLGYNALHSDYQFRLVGSGTLVLAGTVAMTPVKPDHQATIGGPGEMLSVELDGPCEFTVGPTRRLTIIAPISDGPSSGALVKTGQGNLILSGSNSFTGGTTVRNGRLQLARSEVLYDLGIVQLDPSGGVLELLSGVTETIGALGGGSATKGNVILNNSSLLVGAANVATVYRGVISGAGGSVVKIGNAEQTFTNVAHEFAGGLTVRGGTLAIEAAYGSVEAVIPATGNSPLGAGPVVIDGGQLSIRNAFSDTAAIVMQRNISFGQQGGTLRFAGPCRSGAGLAVATPLSDALPAVIRYAHGWDPTAWRFDNSFRLTGAAGAGSLRLELTDGAIATLLAGGSFAPPLVLSGVVGGNCGAATSEVSVGRFGLVNTGSSPATALFQSGLTFHHAVQLSVDGGDCVVGGNITVAPGARVGVQGGQSRSGQLAWLMLGRDSHDVLAIGQNAELDIDSRFRSENIAHGGVHLRSLCQIAPGGLLRLRQSDMAETGYVGFHRLDGIIEGQGSTELDATLEVLLGEKSAPGGPDGGVDWKNSNVSFVVNGSGLGGLRIQGPTTFLEAMLRPSGSPEAGRLRTLSGGGGYLSLAPTDGTLLLPADNQWSAAVGLRVVNSFPGGADLSLALYELWAPKIHIDTAATLAVAQGGLVLSGTVSGGGEIVGGPISLQGIHAASDEMLRATSVMLDGCVLAADGTQGHQHGGDGGAGIRVAGKLQWRGTTAKTGDQRYTLWLEGSDVSIDAGQALLHIREGTLALSGPGDPLSDSLVAGRHLDILNDSLLAITEGRKSAGDINGSGSTLIEAGATLTASFIRQESIELLGQPGNPARLVFRSAAERPTGNLPADGPAASLRAVPAPAGWAALLSAIPPMVLFRLFRRQRAVGPKLGPDSA